MTNPTETTGATMGPICPKCGEEVRMVWLMGDPPEPYGDVCGCPDENEALSEARAEKRAMDTEATPHRRHGVELYDDDDSWVRDPDTEGRS